MPVTPINSLDEYKKVIKSGKPVVIDFLAPWCSPCKTISPILEKLSESDEVKGTVEFYKVDVDEQPAIAQEVGIRAMPTFYLYKNGKMHHKVVGAIPEELHKLVHEHAKALC